ncbi:ABC transporter permease [Candidatus Gracilibacteria bacterium]|nr:ABC transporter permease [Candidatus Gracilibacteria bacterium]
MQLTALYTIIRKELIRIIRIWPQTILPPVITQTLYFIIFGGFIGSRIGEVGGGDYIAFLIPGIILMAVITNAYANVSSSFFGAKFQKSIEELLVAPVHPATIIVGYVFGGILRGGLIALIIYGVSLFFFPKVFEHPMLAFLVFFLVALFFSLLGLINALYAKNFDQVNIIPTFFLTPLTYLGGVFYPLTALSGIWYTLSLWNPLAWMIDSFRYSYTGNGYLAPVGTIIILALLCIVSFFIALWLFKAKKIVE